MNSKWLRLFEQNGTYDLGVLKSILKQLGFKKTFTIIHVVGTNGKGSVATTLSYNLSFNGYKVGLFTSPHLVKPHERIQINHTNITDQDFWKIYESLPQEVNFFGALYLVAMMYFMKNKCDIVILEAGIGGRLDATNTISGDYGILTSVGLDHTEWLGETLLEIAKEKYAVKTALMPFYIPLTIDQDILQAFSQTKTFLVANYGNNYQLQNFLLVKKFLEVEFKLKNINQMLSLPGRSQVFKHNNVLTIFDVAHNLPAIKASLQFLAQHQVTFQDIVVMMDKQKDIRFLPKMFLPYQVYYYQPTEKFHDFKHCNYQKITNLEHFYNQQQAATLYIGSFKLIGALYEFKT